jgi:superfamily II DNA or RNA helicase
MEQTITWRPYQIDCKKAIKEAYDNGITEQLIVQATGTGKRMASIDIMRHFPRSLFIAHREELIMQPYEELQQKYPMQVGIVKGPLFEIDKKIVIASVQTLYNRLDKIDPQLFDYIVIDEAHHYLSKSYLASARHFRPKLLTGWTATPKRLDGLSLSNLFEKIVFEYRIDDGIKDNWLAPIEAYQIKTRVNLKGVKRTAGDFNLKDLSERVDIPERNEMIVQKYLQYSKGEQAIAFCVDIDHTVNLRDKFKEAGISCESVSSDPIRCPNRTELVSDFKQGKIQVLTNVNILTEGFDYEDIGIVIMARPTQSETLYVQAIGRGTRLKSESFKEKFGHDKCTVLDFVDNSANHSLVNAYSLEEGKSLEEKMFLPKEYKDKLIAEREKRFAKITSDRASDQRIDLLQLPEIRIWNSGKMLEPATEKQLNWMKILGVFQEDVEYTKKMASEIISYVPAERWQVNWLKQNGYETEGRHVTIGQYQIARRKFDMENKYKPIR